ncbi:MAG: alpha/beta hydrolase [Myxococcales bacterium]|nr:alpha/beta hydrolase [Myxococcales bacterium]
MARVPGAELHWQAHGSGGPTFVCCNGVGVSTFFFKYVVEHFSDRHQVLLWDYRGHGQSSAPHEPIDGAQLSIERNAEDLQLVLDAASVQGPLILLGHSMGCQVVFEYTHRHPERVAGMVALFGAAGRPLDTFLGLPNAKRAVTWLNRVVRWSGHAGNRLLKPFYRSSYSFDVGAAAGLIDRHYADRSDIAEYMQHLAEIDARVFLSMVLQMAEHDARPYLPTLRIPALIIAGERDQFTPMALSQQMAHDLPLSDLLVLAEASHAAIIEHPETINRRIERFLREWRLVPDQSSGGNGPT